MDTRNFFSLQNVQPNELNEMLAAIDSATKQGNFENGGRGVVYGMGVGPTSPAGLSVKINPGVAYYDAAPFPTGSTLPTANEFSTRILLSTAVSKSLGADYLGNATAVAAGRERWLAIVAVPARLESDPRLDGTGAPVNFVSAEAGDVYVVKGADAAAGSAERVSAAVVRALGVRLAEVLLTYGAASYPDSTAFDLSLREQIKSTLHQQDDNQSNGPQCSLFWECYRDGANAVRGYVVRAVTGGPPAGITVTLNTFWDAVQQMWFGDDAAKPCIALRFGTNGLLVTQRIQAVTSGWPDTDDGRWSDVVNPGNTDSVLMSALGLKIFGNAKSALLTSNGVITASGGAPGVDNSSVTVLAAFIGDSGPNAGSPVGVAVTFPRPFAEDTTLGVLVETRGYPWAGIPYIGPTADVNVDTSTIMTKVTPYGVWVYFSPLATSTITRFSRFITVMRGR